MNRVKKNAKKGFTLIEIIVVLVIIAILAAATVPSMIGFIEEANGKAYASDARVGLVAAQAVATQLVAGGKDGSAIVIGDIKASETSFDTMTKDIKGDFTHISVNSDGRVTEITYEIGDYTVEIKDGNTTVKKD